MNSGREEGEKKALSARLLQMRLRLSRHPRCPLPALDLRRPPCRLNPTPTPAGRPLIFEYDLTMAAPFYVLFYFAAVTIMSNIVVATFVERVWLGVGPRHQGAPVGRNRRLRCDFCNRQLPGCNCRDRRRQLTCCTRRPPGRNGSSSRVWPNCCNCRHPGCNDHTCHRRCTCRTCRRWAHTSRDCRRQFGCWTRPSSPDRHWRRRCPPPLARWPVPVVGQSACPDRIDMTGARIQWSPGY